MGHEVTIWTEKPEDAERLFNMIVDWLPSDEADKCTVMWHPDSPWRPIETAIEAAKSNDGWIPQSLFAIRRDWGWEQWVGQCDDGTIWLGRKGNGTCWECDRPTHWMPLDKPPANS